MDYFYDLSSSGVIIYPCFLDSYGFGGDNSAVVMFMLELGIADELSIKALRSIHREVLYDEVYESLKLEQLKATTHTQDAGDDSDFNSSNDLCFHKSQTKGFSYKFKQDHHKAVPYQNTPLSSIQVAWLPPTARDKDTFVTPIEPKPQKNLQRLSVLLPYKYENSISGAQNFFQDSTPKEGLYAHLTIEQILDILKIKPTKDNLVHIDELKHRFMTHMSTKVRLFFEQYVMDTTTVIGVPCEDGTTTFSSVFGRFLMKSNGETKHENWVSDDECHLLYYHRPAPKLGQIADDFREDLYRIVKRTVSKTLSHTKPKNLLAELLQILEQKHEEGQRPLLMPLAQSKSLAAYDASGVFIHNLKKIHGRDNDKNYGVDFANTLTQLFYICLSEQFFNKHQNIFEGSGARIGLHNIMNLYEAAKTHTQTLINSVKEDMPTLVKHTSSISADEPDTMFFKGSGGQVIISTPMAVLLVGLLQSTVDYSHVVGVEAGPMLIMACALSRGNSFNKNITEFSLANRANRSAASLIGLGGHPSIVILSRYAGAEVSFSEGIELGDSVFVSSLDKRQHTESIYLKFYQKDNGRDHEPYLIRDLSLQEASQAIVQLKNNTLKQVKAGLFVSPYNSVEVGSDLYTFLFWLSFYYETVRVIKVENNLVGSEKSVFVVSFFHPRGISLDYADSTRRLSNIVGFGNIPMAKTVDELADWVYHESLFLLTKDIFVATSKEESLLDTKTIQGRDGSLEIGSGEPATPVVESVEKTPGNTPDKVGADAGSDDDISLSILDGFESIDSIDNDGDDHGLGDLQDRDESDFGEEIISEPPHSDVVEVLEEYSDLD